MKRKLISVLMTSFMVVSAITACGSNAQSESVRESSVSEAGDESIPVSAESDAQSTSEEVEEKELSGVRSTAYGQVVGIVEFGTEVYYGVPYGASPVDELRWQAPVEPETWSDTLDCTEQEEIAMQLSNGEITGSADCLNLDIYTKADAEGLPVLVYVHGGNNQTGSSYGELRGVEICEEDNCVVVSVNYRLGLLGFNCLPALQEEGETGNYGMLDIAKSLEWVRDNIQNFGGDPENVTISGFSAGGRDVMAMLLSPAFEGLFDKAIAFSGGMTIADVTDSQNKVAEILAPLAVEDGIAGTEEQAKEYLLTDSEEVEEYLYSISEERLTTLMTNAAIRMSAFPHLYGDDVLLPSDGFESNEYVNDVPLLMLTGTSEFSFFCNYDSYLLSMDENLMEDTKNFAGKYGNDFYRTFNTQLSAEKMDEAYESDLYLCQINYGGEGSASEIPEIGSFHGIFVPMLYSENNYSSFYDFTQDGYQAMADEFHQYLENFLLTGTPNSEDTEVEWTAWTLEDKGTMVLDADETTKEATAVMEDVSKSNEEIIAEMEADTSVSEEVKEEAITNILNGRWFSADLDAHFGNPSLW